MEDYLELKKRNNIILEQSLACINEQIRENKNYQLAQQNIQNKRIENYLMERIEIQKEKHREITKIEIKRN